VGSIVRRVDATETVKTFGEMRSYESAVRSLVGQYLELKAKDQRP
jgi:hypothetical protein